MLQDDPLLAPEEVSYSQTSTAGLMGEGQSRPPAENEQEGGFCEMLVRLDYSKSHRC